MSINTNTHTVDIVPTCVPHSIEDVQKHIEIWKGIAPRVHIDITDGIFTPEYTWPYTEKGVVGSVTPLSGLDTECEMHCMVVEPRAIADQILHEGMSLIVHAESKEMGSGTILQLKKKGTRNVGVALLLDTPLLEIAPYIDVCDFVLVMGVEQIGAQGALFDARAVSRVRELHSLYPELLIEVDGGVSYENIAELAHAGARRFAVGSAISRAENPHKEYARLKSLAESAVQ